MINKDFRNFMEKENNVDFNYQKIREKITKKFNMKKLANIAAVILVVVLVGIGSNNLYAKRQWKIEFNNYQNRPSEFTTIGIKESLENGYSENINMNYVYQNNIGVKINSILITDDQFEASMNFKFSEDLEIDSEKFEFGYAVYDENNQMYGIFTRRFGRYKERDEFGYDYIKCLLKELNIENYKNNDVFGTKYASSLGTRHISASSGNIISNISMDSAEGFPKSKKIYIRIFDLGFTMIDIENNGGIEEYEDFCLSGNSEWIFEIDIPERMYNRKSIQLKTEKDISGLEVEKVTVSEAKLLIKGKIEKDEEFDKICNNHLEFDEYMKQKIYITDNEGNIYNKIEAPSYTSNQEKFYFEYRFDINKNMLSEKDFFLNIKNDGKLYTEKLIIDN